MSDNKLTPRERDWFKRNLCLKCGSPITTQEYYASLCHDCNEAFVIKFPFCRNEKAFMKFIRKDEVVFT